LAAAVVAAAWAGPSAEAAILEVLTCSDAALRQAISNAAAGDVVLLPPCTIQLTGPAGEDANVGGDVDIDKDLTVVGSGAGRTILDGDQVDRVIDVAAGARVVLEGLTIRNGRAPAGTDGGGIRSFGVLTLSRSEVRDNVADSLGGGVSTGVVGNVINTTVGQLTIEHTTVADNRSGPGNALGGGVFSGRPVLVRRSVVSGNRTLGDSVADGGGIAQLGNTAVVVESEVTGNFADRDGGGIDSSFRLVVLQSAITGNTAGRDGGGLNGGGAGDLDRTDLVQSTVSGNAAGRDGGGVDLVLTTGFITDSTIADNSAARNGGGVTIVGDTTLTLRRTIVAGNPPVECLVFGSGTLTSEGHNLAGDASCSLTLPSDLPATDPLLGPLAANGGPTRTHALLAGSPAIDQGGEEGCGAVDQRGVVRPQDGDADELEACDIGAFERRGPRPGRGTGQKTIDPR
jgi:hypothetical protein